ncbi:MAG: cytidylate kinase-like family protein [Bacteroidales bacterium]|nr:cytidylate kinase-like family protein [Bacteroidales bacterium]
MEKTLLITIGRQFGSGGKAVAEELGRRLGIPVYDNELITEAARKSGIAEEFFKQRDEKRRALFIGMRSGMDDEVLFGIQSDVIRDLASKGSAIFVGRASDYVLREMDCIDVFICAPLEARIKRIMERQNLSESDAEDLIERMDRGRAEYYDFFTFSKWGVASNYDLCLDSSILGIEGTAEMIIDFAKKRNLL